MIIYQKSFVYLRLNLGVLRGFFNHKGTQSTHEGTQREYWF